MIRRLTAALSVFLVLAGSALAQAPEEATAASPTAGWAMPAVQGRVWVSADYLVAALRGSNLPPLVTTSVPGTPRINAGVFGVSGTSTLFGDSRVNDDLRSGVRFRTGYWFDPEQMLGIEAGITVIEGQSSSFAATSAEFPILARPFINATTGIPGSQLVAFPGLSDGAIEARAVSANFYEWHIDLTEKALDEGWFRLYSILGYRYYRYDESVQIRQVLTPTSGNFVPGTQVLTQDRFDARNEFHGIDMGFRSQFVWETLTLEVLTKVAVGRVHRAVNINGAQQINVPGTAPIDQVGGVLALGSNSGFQGSGDWKAMPEGGVALSWQARPNLSLRFGYTFILLNGVARAADKIDTALNPNLLPGGNTALGGQLQPANNNNRVEMWVQAINFGLLWTY